MKLIKLIALLYLSIAVYSCHNKNIKKEDSVNYEIRNQTIDKSLSKETEENLQAIELAVKEILTTSPRYIKLTKGLQKKVVKNGGLYFGVFLQKSPQGGKQKESNYSKTYDFRIYEMYEDRQLNTSRFSFNPENKQLFEYDIANDSLMPIEFDRTLLVKYDSLNKH
ncbi:hypothetical protein [Labilibaculum antarcticum]|uniref:Lipoprotein n=1 Tax=Labilibaculum antarcticum TaxID=1717717 RepID=A0A1Y1CPQ9_9BACT|nr:hypothetical protein [Labilibaculum antarcticum]BAX81231.1 hypothetical protein ALGA_2926 [Labilibaculum antarcticum]